VCVCVCVCVCVRVCVCARQRPEPHSLALGKRQLRPSNCGRAWVGPGTRHGAGAVKPWVPAVGRPARAVAHHKGSALGHHAVVMVPQPKHSRHGTSTITHAPTPALRPPRRCAPSAGPAAPGQTRWRTHRCAPPAGCAAARGGGAPAAHVHVRVWACMGVCVACVGAAKTRRANAYNSNSVL